MTRCDWSPVSGLIHPYREQAVAEADAAKAELHQGGYDRLRVTSALHGYRVEVAKARKDGQR